MCTGRRRYDAQLLKRSRPGALDHDVGLCQQIGKNSLLVRVSQIQSHAFVSPVQEVEERARPVARAVGPMLTLHLDDPHPSAPQQLRTQRTRPQRRQIQHDASCE